MAETINALIRGEEISEMITTGKIHRDTVVKYLAVPEFTEQLRRVMPFIRATNVARLLEIVTEGADRDSLQAIKILEKGAQDAETTKQFYFAGSSGGSDSGSGNNILNVQVNVSDVQQALDADPLIKSDT